MSGNRLPAGALVKVTLEIRIPIEATEDQIEEWLRFECHDNGTMKSGNPLSEHSPDTFGAFGFDWEYTGLVGRREEFDHEKTETGTRYRVRYHRERVSS